MRLRNCLGMTWSVSTLALGSAATRPVWLRNGSIRTSQCTLSIHCNSMYVLLLRFFDDSDSIGTPPQLLPCHPERSEGPRPALARMPVPILRSLALPRDDTQVTATGSAHP